MDIVERLRMPTQEFHRLHTDAADEIEKLREQLSAQANAALGDRHYMKLLDEQLAAAHQQISELRMALETIAYCALSGVEKIDVAVEALGGTTAPKEEMK